MLRIVVLSDDGRISRIYKRESKTKKVKRDRETERKKWKNASFFFIVINIVIVFINWMLRYVQIMIVHYKMRYKMDRYRG